MVLRFQTLCSKHKPNRHPILDGVAVCVQKQCLCAVAYATAYSVYFR